jgi:type I restriction enzyme R subunit
MFLKIRRAVQERYSDTICFSQYEGQIQKLIDTHIESGDVQVITDLVNIFDKEKFSEEVEKIVGKTAKADTIASRTAKYITESMDTDPAFFKKFSKMLEETIEEYKQGRISEAEYLKRAEDIMQKVLNHTDSEIPESLQNNNAGRAYFGLVLEVYKRVCQNVEDFDFTDIALITANKIDEIIKGHIIVDCFSNDRLIGTMKLELEDFLIDVIKKEYSVPLSFEDIDYIIDNSVDVASKWFL